MTGVASFNRRGLDWRWLLPDGTLWLNDKRVFTKSEQYVHFFGPRTGMGVIFYYGDLQP